VLITETGVPASTQVTAGRIYAEVQGQVNTGLALANESGTAANVSFYFTDADGQDFGSGSLTIPAGHQIVGFLNQAPFNGPSNIQGTFTFNSSVPVGAIALRGITNERSEFLLTTLPIPALLPVAGPAILPHFADGSGWTTQVILTNTSDVAQTGLVQFFSQGSDGTTGQPLLLTVNGVNGASFPYSIPAHSMARFETAGSDATTVVGWVQIASTGSDSTVPAAASIFAFRNSQGIAVSQASVLALPVGNAFRTYLETSNGAGVTGPTESGIAIANPSANPASVTVQLTGLDGTALGLSTSINVPANGQISKFLNELFPQLPGNFRAVGRLTSASPVAVAALRGRFNERGDFLITTTPPLNEAAIPTTDLVFPHIVSGLGYATQIVAFGQGGTAKLYLLGQDGSPQSIASALIQP
jgi:hypothetical protein